VLRKEARKGRKLYLAFIDYLTVLLGENDAIYVGQKGEVLRLKVTEW
jgi:hypothetical protein